MNEVVTYSEVKKDTAWNRFAEAFEDSFDSFVAFLQGLVVALIYILPYAIIAAVILIIVLLITKKKRTARKRKSTSAPSENKKLDIDSSDKKEKTSSEKYTGPNYK